nr:unnamed protein product [Callosobruchus chinensis]
MNEDSGGPGPPSDTGIAGNTITDKISNSQPEEKLEIEGLLDIDNRSNPDKFETVIRIISDAANNSMPLKKPFICNSPQPVWWDEECSNFFQLRKRALNRYRLQASLENFITYKKTSAQVKKLFKQKQRSSWVSFLTKLNRRTPIKDIWKFVKSINRKALNTKSPIPEDLIEQFLDKLAPLSASSPPIMAEFLAFLPVIYQLHT